MGAGPVRRPAAVAALALLGAVCGGAGIVSGAQLLVGRGFIGPLPPSAADAYVGAIVLLVGIASLVFALGAWTMKPWARRLGIVSAIATIVMVIPAVLSLQDDTIVIVNGAIGVAILALLWRAGVRAAFGRRS